MATPMTRWLVSIMMASWCFAFQGTLSRPSPPDCYIPCYDNGCGADIICTWDSKSDPNNNLTYTLHWEGHVIRATSHWAVIQRNYFTSHSELQVWVKAQNQDGTESISEKVTLNTADIFKPPPPKVTEISQEPIAIDWISPCDQLMFAVGHCHVRHCTESEKCSQQDEGGVSGSYTLENPQPSTNYSFQVRCACSTSLMSNWSEVLSIRSAEKAPIGTLDVWRDCGIMPTSSECVLTWKKLPMFQARGHILGYNFRLFYNNGTDKAFSESEAAPVGLVCGKVQCYYNCSLKDVTSVSMSAYNALGVTELSHLDILVPVKLSNAIDLEMKENTLSVSWNQTFSIPERIKEYVVQYKEDGSLLGQRFDWVRVNISQTKETIKGHFKKYTAYQVSVFSVLAHNRKQLFSSDIAHFVQGIPPKIPVFKVGSYGTTHVTLLWEPVLMSKQDGSIPYYQLEINKENVYRVDAYPQRESWTYTLTNLTEDQNYEVWIKGVNQAGPGPTTTLRFKTLPNENTWPLILIGMIVILILISFVILFCWMKKACPTVLYTFCQKVPGPHNSNIIREINDSVPRLCFPIMEQHPIISAIEIVDTPPCSFNSQPDKITRIEYEDGDDTLQDILIEKRNRTQHECGKQEYSKMVDSDGEQNEEEEETGTSSWSSEEETSGYEQHFMPTNKDIKEAEDREWSKKDYSRIVDSDEEKIGDEGAVKDNCWSSEEDSFSGYERHFMPTVSEIMEV